MSNAAAATKLRQQPARREDTNSNQSAEALKLNICFYTSTALPKRGGQEAVVDALARALMELGHQVVVLAPKPRPPLQPQDEALPYTVARHPRFYSTHRFVGWYRGYLLKLHRERGFDLVHCHGIHPPGFIAALCRDKMRVPVVITNHEGGLGANNVRVTKPELRRRYVEALARATALVGLSESAENEYRRLYPSAPKIVRIANGVDIERWSAPQTRPAILDEAIRAGEYVLFLGRLRRRKGVDCLLSAFAQGWPHGARQLVIAGAGEEEGALQRQAQALGMADRCRFVGWVDGPAKTYLLQNALFTVIPSRLDEAFGLVALESFAAGRPVLACAVPGLRELIAAGETGLLCEPDSPSALAEGCKSMLADRSRLEFMGEQARRRVAGFGWREIARRHADLYLSLLEPRRREPPESAIHGSREART